MSDSTSSLPASRARGTAGRATLIVLGLSLAWVLFAAEPVGRLPAAAAALFRVAFIAGLSALVYVIVYHGQQQVEAAHLREMTYRQITELMGDFAYVIDVSPTGETRINWANFDVLAALTGRDADDLKQGRSWRNLVHPDDLAAYEQRFALLLQGQPFEGEFRVLDRHGRTHWIHDRARPVWDVGRTHVTTIYGSSHEVTERKDADLKLAASEQRWRQLADNMLDLVSEIDIAGRYTYASPSHQTLLGYLPAELIGRSVFEYVHPDDLPLAEAAYQSALQRNSGGRLEMRYRHQRGHYVWIETIGNLLFDAQGQVMGALFASRDVTARKQAEAALSSYARRMSALYSAALAIGTQPDLPALLNTIIDNACQLLEAEMGGLYLIDDSGEWLQLVANRPPEYRNMRLRLGQGLAGRAAQSGQAFAVPDYKHWPGRAEVYDHQQLGRVLAVPLRLGDRIIGALTVDDSAPGIFEEEDIRVVTLLADQAAVAVENRRLFERAQQEIAERSRAERALRDSEARYRELVENAGEGIAFVSPDEIYLDANPAAEEIFGLERGQLIGRSLRELTAPDQFALLKDQTRKRRAGETSFYEHTIIRADGQTRDVLVTARPRFAPDGRFLGTFAVFRDITERKQAEQALAQARNDLARRNEQLEQILAAGNLLRLQLDMDTALTTIAEAAYRSLGFNSVALNLVDAEADRVWVHTVIDADEAMRQTLKDATYTWRAIQQLMRDEYRRGRCYFIPAGAVDWNNDFPGIVVNAVRESRPQPDAWQPDDALFFPIELHDGEIAGVIWIDDPQDGRRPTDDTLRTLEIFANQAAVAIENARLYQAQQQHAQELERRVAERTAELVAQGRRLQAILDAAGEGIQIMDREARITYINPAAERITGYTAAEVVGRPTRFATGELALPENAQAHAAILSGQSWSGVVVNRRKDGTLYDAAITITPLLDADGRVTGAVAMCRDITPLKELDRLKNQFVARIGHELRTPVANLRLYLDLLQRGKPERWPAYIETLRAETDRLRHLIDSFLEMAQLDAGATPVRYSTFDLNQLLLDAQEERASQVAERGLTLTIAPDHTLSPVMTDRALAAQALAQLLDNAIKYVPPGGHIRLSTGLQDDNGQRWLTLAVMDDGPGLSAEDLAHLYDRFYRGDAARALKVPGAGLGLPITAAIVQQLGGRLTVSSQPGLTTTFTLWLKA